MTDPKLSRIEAWFWRSIAAQPGEHEFVSELVAAIEPSPTLESAQRLEVYADAYYLRLRGVLADDFPRTAALLGEERFNRLVRRYLKAHPSSAPSVRHLGRAMSQFIRGDQTAPPWTADLAALEWARVDAFDAPDDEPITLSALAEIDPSRWPNLRLTPVRSLSVLSAAWPVHRLWAQEDPANVEAASSAIRVWRAAQFKVLHAPMDGYEAAAIARLIRKSTFAEICQVFDDLDEQQAARQSGSLLLRWLQDGIIAAADTQD